jgi:hypothetical protein
LGACAFDPAAMEERINMVRFSLMDWAIGPD